MSTNSIKRWQDSFIKEGYRLALLGATDKMLAEAFECDLQTLDYWKRTKAGFRVALKKGKLKADAKVANSLYKRATGFHYYEEHLAIVNGLPKVIKVRKYVLPESWAANKWLGTRQRETWGEKQTLEITQTNINLTQIKLEGLSDTELKLIESIQRKQLSQHVTDN